MDAKQKICESCHGSGQVSYFKGVSRFLLSTEECPECGGLGLIPPAGAVVKKSSKNDLGTDFKSIPKVSRDRARSAKSPKLKGKDQ